MGPTLLASRGRVWVTAPGHVAGAAGGAGMVEGDGRGMGEGEGAAGEGEGSFAMSTVSVVRGAR